MSHETWCGAAIGLVITVLAYTFVRGILPPHVPDTIQTMFKWEKIQDGTIDLVFRLPFPKTWRPGDDADCWFPPADVRTHQTDCCGQTGLRATHAAVRSHDSVGRTPHP